MLSASYIHKYICIHDIYICRYVFSLFDMPCLFLLHSSAVLLGGDSRDRNFNVSFMEGRSEGVVLMQRCATSRTNFISSCNELLEPTSLSLHISLKRLSLGLFRMLVPAFVSLPFVKISRMISPKP